MQLVDCPYDRTPIDAETLSGGSLLLSCSCCGAQWEWHGVWMRRTREPNRDAVIAARAGEAATDASAGRPAGSVGSSAS